MMRSTVNVAVRIRPLTPHELENGSTTCVTVIPGKQKIQVADAQKSYRFDCVFGPEDDNKSFYDSAIKNLVFKGFYERDVIIVAYGQRSSGKTHTMGTNYTGEENPGIIPRAVDTLFEVIGATDDHTYQVTVTFVEVYNKELYDLLAPDKVREERIVEVGKDGSEILDLTEREVTNAEEALQCLTRGSQERATSEKRGNSQSTRSHAVFTISVKRRKEVDPRVATTSKLHLVDLAGSSHSRKAGKRGNINKDLLAVGNLMNQIQKGKSTSYTKYRDSKLAILLRDSLCGNSMTLIVACVSPADCSLNETLDTLRYANRLRKMKNTIVEKGRDAWDWREMDSNAITTESNLCDSDALFSTSQDVDGSSESRKTDEQDKLSSEMVDTVAKRIQNHLDARKSNQTEQETDEDIESEKIQDDRESNKTSKTEQERVRTEIDDETSAERYKDDSVPSEDNTTQRESIQNETDDKAEGRKFQDAPKSSEFNESQQEPSETDEDSELGRTQDCQGTRTSSGTKQESVNSESDDEVEERGSQNALKSIKSSESERESSETDEDSESDRNQDSHNTGRSSETKEDEVQSETEDETEGDRTLNAQDSSESIETGRKSLDDKTIEDSASKFFLKIADYFLEPSPTEQCELQNEIRSLQEKLRDRTEKLNNNLTDALSRNEREELSERRRDSAKSVVTRILDEFQEVLVKIVENSGKRDLITRVSRRIHEQLNEQQKVAEKMLERETLEDSVMDEKYAQHTMRQVERYQELQGVNRCIALLKELIVSLPVQSAPVEELVSLLEETSSRIKALETEKVNLVQVLKNEETTDERRRSTDYEVEKVLALDESISMLWRRRIKQMICVERREKFDQQIAKMKAQIKSLRSSRGRLVKEMKDAEKQWKRTISAVQEEKRIREARTKKATRYPSVSRKCACKVTRCLSRRCTCMKNGVSCTDCDCNAKLCRNSKKDSNKENNAINASVKSSVPSIAAGGDQKCGCKTECSNLRCACRKNGNFCDDSCQCRADFCKNKKRENDTSDESSVESSVSPRSTDGKIEIDRAAASLPVDLCTCRKNGTTCAICNRSPKLPDYRTKRKARRRLFAEIEPHEKEGIEPPSKRPRLET